MQRKCQGLERTAQLVQGAVEGGAPTALAHALPSEHERQARGKRPSRGSGLRQAPHAPNSLIRRPACSRHPSC